jgi:hypothetical protein
MSGYRSEASSRSAVKTELTSARLKCLLISLASGLSQATHAAAIVTHLVTRPPMHAGRGPAT